MDIKYALNQTMMLANIQRYSMIKLSKDESVLEHSGFVTMAVFFITTYLLHNGEEINIQLAMEKAILHDFDESVTGDLPRTFKYSNEKLRNMIQEIEDANMQKISYKITGDDFIFDVWREAKSGNEGLIVGLCDFISAIYKIHNEVVLRGNRTMKTESFNFDRMEERLQHIIVECKDKFEKSSKFFTDILIDGFSKLEECKNA